MCWVSVGVELGKLRRQFTGIEPAMGCDAHPTLNRNWVGGPTYVYEIHRGDMRQHSLPRVEWMLASTGDGGSSLNRHCVSNMLTCTAARDSHVQQNILF